MLARRFKSFKPDDHIRSKHSETGLPAPSPSADEARRARLTAIGLMCAAVLCFALLDTNAKWLGLHGMDPLLVTFARYGVSVVLVSFLINPWSHPGVLRTKRPWL